MENRTGISNVKLHTERSYLEWAPIENVLPNPLNPRKNDAIKSETLQKLIKRRGWEIPITVYKKGTMYVVLSGHRRLFAARSAGMKEIPCYVVSTPKTLSEEIERIAGAQSGQEDWTVWEWTTYTYERWVAFGRPSFAKFADLIDMPKRTVEQYCQVMEYYPTEEIEASVKRKALSISVLYEAYAWIKFLKKSHPDLVATLSEDLIRRVFIKKVENGKVSREAVRKREFIEKANGRDLLEFFSKPELSLEEIMVRSEFNINERSFHGKIISVGLAKKNIKNMAPKNKIEASKAADALSMLIESAKAQLQSIERQYPDSVKKEDLFTWGKK